MMAAAGFWFTTQQQEHQQAIEDQRAQAERELAEQRAQDEALQAYFDPLSWELFMHWIECGRAGSAHNWPEPPEVVCRLTEAKDVAQAIEKVLGEGWNCLVYDEETLITERRLKPRPLTSRDDPEAGRHVPIDPYEDVLEDLSEQ